MKAEHKNLLVQGALTWQIELTDRQVEQFAIYADFLREYNEKVNLTALTEEIDIVNKHFLDSISLTQLIELKPGLKIIDIGTGAGFPGVPLLILQPKLKMTLLDSLNKRLVFLQELLLKLDLHAELVHSRAEDAAKEQNHRASYDWALARAVAPLPQLLEFTLPFVKVQGNFLAMKGPTVEEELIQAQKALRVLGGQIEKEIQFLLPNGEDERRLLLIKKTKKTPDKYPRNPSQIKKSPL